MGAIETILASSLSSFANLGSCPIFEEHPTTRINCAYQQQHVETIMTIPT